MENVDHNALLLQVMAHDLLAPLTAVKWQTELLGKEHPGDTSGKYFERLQNLYESTLLGISLTKHAHVAGQVLVGSYAPDPVEVSLTDVVRKAALDLKLQYERHGLSLEVEVDEDATLRQVDVHLVSLYVWSLAKFFLSCAPAQTTVSFRGLVAPNQNGGQSFVLIGSAPGIPEADVCVRTFSSEEAQGAFDHAFVFAKLIRTVAPLIKVSTTAAAQGNQLVIETAFEL